MCDKRARRFQDFKVKSESLIEELEKIVNEYVKSTGDKSEDCQRLYLLQNLREFEMGVNGTTEKDMIVYGEKNES